MNVNKSTVTRWKQDGRLVMEGALVNVAASQQRIKETEGGRDDVAARHAAERGAALPTVEQGDSREEDEAEQGSSEEVGTRAYWQARKERALALAAERDNEIAMGNLISLQETEAVVADMVIRFRQALENLPHAMVPELIGKDREAMIAICKENNRNILQNLERGFAEQLKVLGVSEV